jgi:hypothetical protein
MVFTYTKIVDIGSFTKAMIRIWSQTFGSGPARSGSATLNVTYRLIAFVKISCSKLDPHSD